MSKINNITKRRRYEKILITLIAIFAITTCVFAGVTKIEQGLYSTAVSNLLYTSVQGSYSVWSIDIFDLVSNKPLGKIPMPIKEEGAGHIDIAEVRSHDDNTELKDKLLLFHNYI